MASVVIIHAADDTLPARALGEKLRLAKLEPVFEKAAGEERQNAVKNAAVAIVLWSPRSLSDQGVIADASFARSKGKMLQACMQSTQPPDQFRNDKAVNLTGWRGEDDFQAWRELADLVTRKAGVAPLPPPAPRPPSGFFQPGRPVDAPPPPRNPAQPQPRAQQQRPQQQRPQQAPRATPAAQRSAPTAAPRAAGGGGERKKGGGMAIALIALVAIAAAGGGGFFFWQQSQAGASASAWEAVDTGNANALRAFLANEPGQFRDEAETALAELDRTSFAAAMADGGIEALQAYLQDFPDSENALAARGRIAELQTAQQAAAPTPIDPAAQAPAPAADPVPAPPAPDQQGPTQIAPAPAPDTPAETPPPG